MSERSALSPQTRVGFLLELQNFCLNYDHAVREVPRSVSLYEYTGERRLPRRAPTFIYSFFSTESCQTTQGSELADSICPCYPNIAL